MYKRQERGRAQDWIEDLVKRSREASEALMSTVSSEVDRQLGERGLKNFDLDDLAQRVAAIITMAGNAGPVSYTHLDVYKRQ